MVWFWLSVVLAVFIGSCTLLGINNGIGLQLIGLVLAGNAYVRLKRGKPAKARLNFAATVVALVVSGVGFALGVYRVMQ